ncbi:MAG TPA: tripartite tricarboxylate transporter substrate binding protein [Xanthobacteraceae bacterium]|nr:tripartite tricarboxylate transporter substrate binding protein [Xanthobacteraceae bacterium]
MRVALARMSARAALAALLFAALAIPTASAQTDYPTRPIKIVVGFGAGGGTDILARLVGAKLGEILHQSVVIENRPGAAAQLAAEYVAGQPGDGYTLLASPIGAMSIAAAVYSDLKYSPTKSFVPLALIGQFPLILAVSPTNPANNVKELVAYAKQHPDKANYPSTSPAFVIPMEELKLASGMPGEMIPYKSSQEMILSVMEGQSMMTIVDPPPTVPQVKAGKLKALAVTGSERLPELPDVPSMTEAGFPSVDVHLWSGMFAPAGTPPAVLAKIEKALAQAIHDPGVSAKLHALAINPSNDTPEQFKQLIESDIVKFRAVAKAANLKFEH